jgi:hypothetical protein
MRAAQPIAMTRRERHAVGQDSHLEAPAHLQGKLRAPPAEDDTPRAVGGN